MPSPTQRTLTLPWPPTVNTYWRKGKGNTYLSKRGKAFRSNVEAEVLSGLPRRFSGRIRMDVRAFPPDAKVRDIDNLLKALNDSLEHAGVFESDNQVDDLRIYRARDDQGNVILGGKVEVTIKEMDDEF